MLKESKYKDLTFEDCITLAYEKMTANGKGVESGTVVISATDDTHNDQYSYRIKKLGQKFKEKK